MDLNTFIIIIISTTISAFLSSMSGGGASVISLPIFLWIGIPLPLSIATHKLSSVFWTPISAYNYLRDRKVHWKFLILFTIIGLIGAYFGVKIVSSVNEILLSKIIGIIILIFVIYTYFKKNLGLKEKKGKDRMHKIIAYPASIIMGFYESILGSGNGIVFTLIAFYSRGFDFIDAIGHYFLIAFFWVTFASGLLIYQGHFDVGIMSTAVIGSIIGSYFGSKYAKYKGNKFIKNVFIIVGGVLAIKLLLT